MRMTKNFGLGKTVVIQIVEPLKSVGDSQNYYSPSLCPMVLQLGTRTWKVKNKKQRHLNASPIFIRVKIVGLYIYKIHILGPLQICFPIFIRVKIAGLYISLQNDVYTAFQGWGNWWPTEAKLCFIIWFASGLCKVGVASLWQTLNIFLFCL